MYLIRASDLKRNGFNPNLLAGFDFCYPYRSSGSLIRPEGHPRKIRHLSCLEIRQQREKVWVYFEVLNLVKTRSEF